LRRDRHLHRHRDASSGDLADAFAIARSGKQIRLTLLRATSEITLTV